MTWDGVYCDVCGEPATHAAWDCIEIGEVVDQNGIHWPTYEEFGDCQFGCSEHRVHGAIHRLNGTTDGVEAFPFSKY